MVAGIAYRRAREPGKVPPRRRCRFRRRAGRSRARVLSGAPRGPRADTAGRRPRSARARHRDARRSPRGSPVDAEVRRRSTVDDHLRRALPSLHAARRRQAADVAGIAMTPCGASATATRAPTASGRSTRLSIANSGPIAVSTVYSIVWPRYAALRTVPVERRGARRLEVDRLGADRDVDRAVGEAAMRQRDRERAQRDVAAGRHRVARACRVRGWPRP